MKKRKLVSSLSKAVIIAGSLFFTPQDSQSMSDAFFITDNTKQQSIKADTATPDLQSIYRISRTAVRDAKTQLDLWQKAHQHRTRTVKQQALIARIQFNIAIAQEQYDDAKYIIHQLQKDKISPILLQGEAIFMQAWLAFYQGHYNKSDQYLNILQPMANIIQSSDLLLRYNNLKGLILLINQSYRAAFLHFQSALTHHTQQTTEGLAFKLRILSNLSLLEIELNNKKDALTHIQTALSLYEQHELNDTLLLTLLYTNFFKIQPEGNVQLAWLEKVEKNNQQLQDTPLSLAILLNRATYFRHLKKWDQAQDIEQQCINEAKESKLTSYLASCQYSYLETLLAQNNTTKALEVAYQIIQQPIDNNIVRQINTQTLEQLSQIHALRKEYDKALDTFKQHHEHSILAIQDARQKKLNQLKDQFSFDTEQNQLALLAAEHKVALLQISQQKLRNNVNGLISFFLLSSLIYFYRQHRRTFSQNEALLKSNEHLYRQSHQDPLTGLKNRRYFDKKIKSMTKYHPDQFCSLAMIDLDHFKQINDQYGHDVGDQVLKEFAQRLQAYLPQHNELIRWGGEEFCVLFFHHSPQDALQVESLLTELNHHIAQHPFIIEIRHEVLPLSVTISIGTVIGIPCSKLSTALSTCLTQADDQLYKAKSSGRNQNHSLNFLSL